VTVFQTTVCEYLCSFCSLQCVVIFYRWWTGWQPKSVRPNWAGSGNAVWFNPCTLYSNKSRHRSDDREVSVWRFWPLSKSVLWESTHAAYRWVL